MRYINEYCAVCGKKIRETSHIVVCFKCGTPHHSSCWKGKCQNFDKHNYGYTWKKGEVFKKEECPPLETVRESNKIEPSVIENSESYKKSEVTKKSEFKTRLEYLLSDIVEVFKCILIILSTIAVPILLVMLFTNPIFLKIIGYIFLVLIALVIAILWDL